MTPRERAIQVVEASDRQGYGCPSFETQAMIEQAISAAIEAERKECAKILRDVYHAWVDGDYSPGEAFESASEKILHRSTASRSAEPKVK